ncbi:hypothetical protein [Halobellus sp. Atlit-38R]|uniref:DUF7261 family protein n=1 Tax=Halobellus sp. Atlit-38R TaxID=2282131 RepID=UPI0011C3D4D7|nr:hypothetical protein [Halobellus sp. Atlit-38R]
MSNESEVPSNRSDRGTDRAQLLLVGALALAVLFVALALLLNTAIYTGNLATRDASVDATPVIEYVSESREAGVDAIRSVNDRNNSDPAELASALHLTIARWDEQASYHRAVAGDITAVEVGPITNGTRIQQDDESRDFTNETGEENWTVAAGSDLSEIRSLRFAVEESTLPEDPSIGADEVFTVEIDSDAGATTLYVYDTSGGGGPEIRVDDGGDTETCSSGTSGTFAIDVANESVGGVPCPSLSDLTDVGDDVAIEFRDSHRAGGTYSMVVDEQPSDLSTLGVDDVGSGSPYWTYAVYSAQFNVTYRTEDVDYATGIEVAPE